MVSRKNLSIIIKHRLTSIPLHPLFFAVLCFHCFKILCNISSNPLVGNFHFLPWSSSSVMAVYRHRYHILTVTAFTLLLSFSASLSQLGCGIQEKGDREKRSGLRAFDRFMTQKRLSGPGSSPPTCRSKCGDCCPCEPVHVPIQPGMNMPLEYYPKDWRCKCGKNLFMP